MADRGSDVASIVVISTLGIVLACVYYFVLVEGETGDYFSSRYWVDIPRSTTKVLTGFQLAAVVGFFMFVPFAVGIAAHKSPRKGILSYLNGYASTVIFAVFFLASIAWPFAARRYLDQRKSNEATLVDLLATVLTLAVAAVCSILFTAGAFESDMHPVGVAGAILFSSVIVLADGIGWNAKLIINHHH